MARSVALRGGWLLTQRIPLGSWLAWMAYCAVMYPNIPVVMPGESVYVAGQ